jgi:hypothetical protein
MIGNLRMWLETETKEKMRVGKNKNEGERGKAGQGGRAGGKLMNAPRKFGENKRLCTVQYK